MWDVAYKRVLMNTTSVSLLVRLRDANDQDAWRRFADLYAPLIQRWIRPFGLPEQDAEELAQEVFAKLVRELPKFTYDPGRSFRAWLSTVTRNIVRSFLASRGPDLLTNRDVPLESLATDDTCTIDADEFHQYVTRRALMIMQADFESSSWQAFWRMVVDGQSGSEVARQLEMSVSAVYVSKHRVMRRLRDELAGMLDD